MRSVPVTRGKYVLAALAALVLAAACGLPQARPTPTPTPSPTPTPQPVVAIVQPGSPKDVLRLVSLDGREVARTLIPQGAPIAGVGGQEVGFVDHEVLRALRADGQVVQLGTLAGFKAGSRVVLSPDGKQWLWSTSQQRGDGLHSVVYLNNTLLADSTEPDRVLQPVTWTKKGPIVEHAVVGAGGYQLFDVTSGPADLLNTDTGGRTALTDGSCLFAALADDGAVACRVPGPSFATTTALRITPSGGQPVNVPMPADRMSQVGGVSFRPGQAATVVLGGSPAKAATSGGQGEVYETDLIDVASAALRPFGQPGLRPGDGQWAWLPNGSVICYRPANAAGGDPGVYIVQLGGGVQQLTPSGRPVGVLMSSSGGGRGSASQI